MNSKKIFSKNSTIFLLIAIILWQFYNNISIINQQTQINKENEPFKDSLINALSNLEGLHIGDFTIQSEDGSNSFSEIFKNDKNIIIFYQSDLVCNPCLYKLLEYWKKLYINFPDELLPKLVIISNSYKRGTYVFCKKNGFEGSYFVDKKHFIRKSVFKYNYPVNLLFYVNNSQQIVYADYFDYHNRKKILIFLKKIIRYMSH